MERSSCGNAGHADLPSMRGEFGSSVRQAVSFESQPSALCAAYAGERRPREVYLWGTGSADAHARPEHHRRHPWGTDARRARRPTSLMHSQVPPQGVLGCIGSADGPSAARGALWSGYKPPRHAEELPQCAPSSRGRSSNGSASPAGTRSRSAATRSAPPSRTRPLAPCRHPDPPPRFSCATPHH